MYEYYPCIESRPRATNIYTTFAIIISIILNIPLVNTLLTSFKSEAILSTFPPKFIFEPSFENYTNVLYAAGYNFPSYFLNSVLISLCSSFLVVFITLPAAYSILRLNFGTNKLISFVAGLRLFLPIIFVIPYYLMLQYLGLLDTVLGLVLINTFLNVPLGLILLIGFLRDIPVEIEEAAKLDGCSAYGILLRIIFPLLKPGIASVAILTFIFSWNDYLFALTISMNNSVPVTLGATLFITSWGVEWGNISAATILSVLPPLIFTFFAQRYLVSGLSMGAIKG